MKKQLNFQKLDVPIRQGVNTGEDEGEVKPGVAAESRNARVLDAVECQNSSLLGGVGRGDVAMSTPFAPTEWSEATTS